MGSMRERGRALAVLLAAAVLLGGMSVVPARAAVPSTYTMEFLESPSYALSDHTGFGVRFGNTKGTAGIPDGQYYVKVLLANTNSSLTWDAALHRGFTWNSTSKEWVQQESAWADFPTVAVATGSIAKSWAWGKFGDETASGTYYVHVVLCAVSDGTLYYPGTVKAITIADPETGGGWIHNGTTAADPLVSGKRLAVFTSNASTTNNDPNYPPTAPTATLLSLWEMQANLIDDDGNGLIDAEDVNENYGPQATNLGDYRLGIPIATVADVYANRVLVADDFTTGAADCDIAVGAAEIVPPDAVDDLDAVATETSVDLTWTAVTDAGEVGYMIYRWETLGADPVPYTPAPVCIGTVAAGTTTYSDTDFEYEVEYAYQVRAIDASTNVGPRSNAVTLTVVTPPTITTTEVPGGMTGVTYSAALLATGATPITWSVSAGSLPAGLTLAPATGIISGKPTTAGTFVFTAKAANATGDDTQALSITIAAAPLYPVYRFYNFTNNTHFFTSSLDEANSVILTYPNVYSFEGVAYYTNPLNNTQPLYRFYNRVSGSHFYTASLDEANSVIANYSNVFTYDGQAYSVSPVAVPNSVPVYRFYNVRNGSHFYTSSTTERDAVLANWPDVYRLEGEAFWIGQ